MNDKLLYYFANLDIRAILKESADQLIETLDLPEMQAVDKIETLNIPEKLALETEDNESNLLNTLVRQTESKRPYEIQQTHLITLSLSIEPANYLQALTNYLQAPASLLAAPRNRAQRGNEISADLNL